MILFACEGVLNLNLTYSACADTEDFSDRCDWTTFLYIDVLGTSQLVELNFLIHILKAAVHCPSVNLCFISVECTRFCCRTPASNLHFAAYILTIILTIVMLYQFHQFPSAVSTKQKKNQWISEFRSRFIKLLNYRGIFCGHLLIIILWTIDIL